MSGRGQEPSAPSLSVIIVNWNTCTQLRECLQSVKAGQSVALQAIVVDNASQDDSVEMVRSNFPSTDLIVNKTNQGFSRANNQGIRASTGELVLLLNSDTVATTSAIERLVAFLATHPEAGACGPRLVQKDGRTQPFAFGGDPTPGYLFRRGLKRLLLRQPLYDWETDKVQEVDWVSGAALLTRREALEQVGGFDDKFFMYFEDNDLCLRMRRAGWKIYYNPEVTITHIGGASLAQSDARTRWYDASLRYFYTRHYSPLACLLLEIMLPFYRRVK